MPAQSTTQPGIDPVTGLPVSATPGEPATYNPPPPTDTFSADNNLINSQILPTADPRVTEQQQAGDAGLQAQDIAPDIAPPGADPRLLKFQNMTDNLLAQLQSQPDRLGLAKQYYDTFEAETEPDYNRSLTEATNMGAAHGRLGSGILTNTYGDLAERRLRDKEVQKQNLLNAATEGTIADRQRMFENLSSAEQNAFGEAGANTNELQQERDARRALIQQHYSQADKAIADAAAARGEQRGERGYQQGLAERALLARIQQQMAEGNATQQDYNNALAMFGAGNTGDPTGAYSDAAAAAGATSGQDASDVALLLRLLAQRQAGAAGGSAAG
jgi:hypothetical protein